MCAVSSSTSPNVNARPLLENGRATHDAFIQAWQDGTGLIPPRLFFFLYPASLSAFHFLVDLIYHFVTHVVPPPHPFCWPALYYTHVRSGWKILIP